MQAEGQKRILCAVVCTEALIMTASHDVSLSIPGSQTVAFRRDKVHVKDVISTGSLLIYNIYVYVNYCWLKAQLLFFGCFGLQNVVLLFFW